MDISGANTIGARDEDRRKPSMTDEEIYHALKQLPDFDRFPLPAYWYEKFNIPKPTIPTLNEALKYHTKIQNAPGDGRPIEMRGPAPGGVRPLLDPIPIEIKCEPICEHEADVPAQLAEITTS